MFQVIQVNDGNFSSLSDIEVEVMETKAQPLKTPQKQYKVDKRKEFSGLDPDQPVPNDTSPLDDLREYFAGMGLDSAFL